MRGSSRFSPANEGVDLLAHLHEVWRGDAWVKPFFTRYRKVLALTLALGLAAFVFAGALMFTSGYMISLAATLPFTVLALHVPSLFVLCTFPRCSFVFSDWASPFFNISSVWRVTTGFFA